MTNRLKLSAVPVLLVLAVLAGCGGGHHGVHHPSAAACKTAMKHDYAHAQADPSASPAGEPAACKGLPANVLKKLAAEILSGR